MTIIHYPAKAYRDLKREQLLQTAYALEDTRDRALRKAEALAAVVAAVDAIHTPERRYSPDDGESSYATAEEAAEAEEGTPVTVTHFDVCSHCASLELGDGYTLDYRESLWPCKTRRDMDAAREGMEA